MLLAQHKDILITNSAHCTKRLSHTDAQNYKQLAGSLLGVEETREGAVSWRLRGCCPFNHPIRTSRACLNQPISALACFTSHRHTHTPSLEGGDSKTTRTPMGGATHQNSQHVITNHDISLNHNTFIQF